MEDKTMKNMKLWSVILLLTVIICLLAPISEPVPAAASPVLVKSASSVVSSGVSASNGTVIYDSSAVLYKMWYVQTTMNDTARSYLYNLLNLDLGSTLAADLESGNFSTVANSASDQADMKAILRNLATLSPSQITTYLNSISTELKYATSPDGISWTDQGIVTFPTAAWDEFISAPDVIKDGSTYKMWYTGYTVNSTDLQTLFTDLNSVSLSSADISTLLSDFFNGNIAGLRSEIVTLSLEPTIANILTDALALALNSAPAIGYATSTNGTSWTQDPSNPVMVTNSGGWDNLGIMTPSVVKNGLTYEMWYSGIDVGAGLLTGLTGATSISDIQTALRSGVNVAIGYATSTDGETWDEYATPVLEQGISTDWDCCGVFAPSVVMNANGSYDMWYTGANYSVSSFFDYLNHTVTLDSLLLTGVNSAIGHATSANGTTWTKDTAANPVLSKSAGSAWDNGGVAFPSVIARADHIYLWYTGVTSSPAAALTSFLNGGNLSSVVAAGSATSAKIGYASAALPTGPLVSSAATSTNGNTITVTFNKAIATLPSDAHTEFTYTAGSTTGLAFTAAVNDTNPDAIDLTTATPITYADGSTVTLQYTGTDVLATDGGVLGNITSQAVTNNVSTPVDLGTAGNFVILAESGITNTGTTSITGDIGVSPISSTAITGFGLTLDASGQFATSTLVTGKVYASNYAFPTANILTHSVNDMGTAYTTAMGLVTPVPIVNEGAGNLGGLTLAPGIYKFSSSVNIASPGLTLDAGGNSDAVWVFQISGNLSIAASQSITLSGGALPQNIFWQVVGNAGGNGVELFANSVFDGNILCATNIVMDNEATLNGRALAQTAVTLDDNTITIPTPTITTPTVSSAATSTNGNTITVTFNKAIATLPSDAHTEFTYTAGSTTGLAFTAAVNDTNPDAIDLTTAAPITYADGSTVTLQYTGTDVLATDGGVLGNITIQSVTNNVPTPAPTLSSIAVTPSSPVSLAAGLTQQFMATGTYSDSSTADITSLVTWASDNNAVATISSAGLAIGVAAGTANITASLSSINSTPVTLTVMAPTVVTVVTPAPPPAPVNGVSSVSVGNIVNTSGVFQTSATVETTDGNATVTIPDGTTGLTSAGTPLSTITVTPQATPPAPPTGSNVVGVAYDFGPNGATFSPPISMKFNYIPANIPAGVPETSLVIAFYNTTTSQWVIIPGAVVDTVNHTITVPVSHFTLFTVMAQTTTATTTLTTTPVPVLTGQVTTTPTSTPTTPVPVLNGQVTTTPTTTPSITSGTPTPTQTTTKTSTGLSSGWIIAIAVIGAVVVVIVVLAVIMGIRRKK
jgi:predicted GH43/DUF377 family glycosyl hydrolase